MLSGVGRLKARTNAASAASGFREARETVPNDGDEVDNELAMPAMSRRHPTVQNRSRRWRALGIFLRVVCIFFATLAAFFGGFVFLFFQSDFVGVSVTEALIQSMMPRPELYAAKQPNSKIDGQAQLNTVAALLRQASVNLDSLVTSGTSDFDVVAKSPFASSEGEGEAKAKPFRYLFHRPNLVKYGPHQWLWDSCFHILINAGRDPTRALHELLSLFAMQNDATGFIPEMTYWQPDPNQHGIPGMMYGYGDPQRRFTDLTQMPMVVYPIERLFKKLTAMEAAAAAGGGDGGGAGDGKTPVSQQFLEFFLPRALRYLQYWRTHRDPNNNTLVSIFHPWESGLDASPLYDPVHGYFYRGSTESATPRGVGQTPTPRGLYPKFIVLLYRYRHRHAWNLSDIFARCHGRFDVEDVGVNAVLADGFRLIADLGYALERSLVSSKDRGDAGRAATLQTLRGWIKEAERSYFELSRAIFRLTYVPPQRSGQTGFFRSFGWSPDRDAYIALTGKTIQSLMPLLLLSDANIDHFLELQAKFDANENNWLRRRQLTTMRDAVLQALTNPTEFGMPFGVPTTSHSSIAFDPADSTLMWRGPSWPTTNWFIFQSVWRLVAHHTGDDNNLEDDAAPPPPSAPISSPTTQVDEKQDPSASLRPSSSKSNSGVANRRRPHHDVHGEATTSPFHPLSWRPVNIAIRLLSSWLSHHRDHGFHEYYCPKTGKPLGQAGLGMSHSVVDVLNVLTDSLATSIEPRAAAEELRDPHAAAVVAEASSTILTHALRLARISDDRDVDGAARAARTAAAELRAFQALLEGRGPSSDRGADGALGGNGSEL